MRERGRILSAVAVLLAMACASRADFALDWFTVDGGGGASTGGVFSVMGTVGQPDAGERHAGGSFWVRGGFWSLSDEGDIEPALAIVLTAANAVKVLWPSPSTGYVLQQITNLVLAAWSTPSESTVDDGTSKYIIVNPAANRRIYRLQKP